MTDELVKRHIEQLRLTGGDLADLCQPLADAIEQLTAERDRLREALRDGRRLLAIAQDDRIRLLIQLQQCEASHE
jgi:hypothetical protein